MIARIQRKQTAYLGGLFMFVALSAQATEQAAEPISAWYYHETLTTPADSRAVLKPYQRPEFRQQSLANQVALKQWSWLKQHKLHRHLSSAHPAYLAPKNQQSQALPFWPALKPK